LLEDLYPLNRHLRIPNSTKKEAQLQRLLQS
jgi:hypothetical protein